MSANLAAFILPAAAAFLPVSVNAAASIETPPQTTQAPILTTRGVLQPRQSADIAASMSARITHAPHKAGQSFARGDILIRFDCARLKAEKSALIESGKAYALKAENINELHAAGAAGSLETALASAETRKAQAELKVAEAKLKDCVITAPFAGKVAAKHISAYDTPAAGAPLYSVIKIGAPEIKLIAPSTWLSWTKAGTRFTFKVDETGKDHTAKIIRLGAVVDPVSQTIELTGAFNGSASGAIAGMSGQAEFTAPKKTQP